MDFTLFFFVAATVILGLLFLAYLTQSTSRGKKMAALAAENADLKGRLELAREEMKAVKDEFSQARPELAELRSKYKAAKKETFEADEKIQKAREHAAAAENEERKAREEASRVRDELAAARAETEKAQKSSEVAKTENARLGERIRELEERGRQRQPEPPKVVERAPAPQQVHGLQDRLARLERKYREIREIGLEKARQTERARKRLDAVERAYEVLRGQYNALHDRLLHQMGREGEAEDRDTLMRDSEPPHPAAEPDAAQAPVPPGPQDVPAIAPDVATSNEDVLATKPESPKETTEPT
jgi:chromosome segregation ATPase